MSVFRQLLIIASLTVLPTAQAFASAENACVKLGFDGSVSLAQFLYEHGYPVLLRYSANCTIAEERANQFGQVWSLDFIARADSTNDLIENCEWIEGRVVYNLPDLCGLHSGFQ